MPGAGAEVRIRGTTSINTSSDPLYVIDGIISSSGIDGSRGANGVILVTTRNGQEGRAKVTFDAQIGLAAVRKDYDLLSPYEYALALNDIRGSQTISAADLEAYKNDPRHKAVSALCKSIREDRVAVDYEF